MPLPHSRPFGYFLECKTDRLIRLLLRGVFLLDVTGPVLNARRKKWQLNPVRKTKVQSKEIRKGRGKKTEP